MPISIPDALAASGAAAADKAAQARDLPRYLVSSALAGMFVGIAVVLLLETAGPFAVAGAPATVLVQGLVFGLALTLVVFAGGELFTGNVMVLTQGRLLGNVGTGGVLRVCAISLVGNLFGSIGFAAAVDAAGTLSNGPSPTAAQTMLGQMLQGKIAASGPQLFWRALLCNLLVCLGLWMATRATTDTAKLLVLGWALLAFIASGFEHSVANMTTFSLGALSGVNTWEDLYRNLLWTIPGNVVGGGLLVGLLYGWIGGAGRRAQTPVPAADLEAGLVAMESDGLGGARLR